jgi:predicted nucleotidyltransferase
LNTELFNLDVLKFIEIANSRSVKMLLVGGGAVNFYGYQRHSADVDFWVDISEENLNNLKQTIIDFGFEIDSFPKDVFSGDQNISIKISPISEIELITRFNPNCTFNEAWQRKNEINFDGITYYLLKLEDLIESKIKSLRPKDLLDIYELKRIHCLD